MIIVNQVPTKNTAYVKAVAKGSKRSDSWLRMLKDLSFYLTPWEHRFMMDVGKKLDHNLTHRQIKTRNEIITKYGFQNYLNY